MALTFEIVVYFPNFLEFYFLKLKTIVINFRSGQFEYFGHFVLII